MVKWIITGVVVVTLILIGFIVAAVVFPTFRVVSRDIAITLLAVLQMLGAILTVALLFAVLYAVNAVNKLARDTVVPKIDTVTNKVNELLDTTRTIAGNVRDASSTATSTTTYVAERVVSPVIRVSGLIAGVRAAATTLARRSSEPRIYDSEPTVVE